MRRQPFMPSTLASQVASQLKSSGPLLEKMKVVVGFDGFVDSILHVVKTRESATKYERFTSMGEWAGRLSAAAGLSANFEFVTQMVKLGGNGPNMANALDAYGTPLTYIGNLGKPALHPVFQEFARRAKVISIAEPGFTDALEFDDGKLMLGKQESLKDVNWANLIAQVPEENLVRLFSAASLIAIVNWTMLPQLSAVFQKLLTRVAPKLKGAKRWVFFDLADPAKRSREDLMAVLKLISKFERYFHVILGLNLGEARQVSELLGFRAPDETYGTVSHHASLIREKLKVHTVVIHPVEFAAACDQAGATHVVGPFTSKPKITTGAGDHFNAGFCIGRMLGLGLPESLQIGVATSGFYVRNARSPSLKDVRRFLQEL